MKIKGKEVKLTLNKAWKMCLDMWKEIHLVRAIDISDAKSDYLKENDIKEYLINDCFFCTYADEKSGGIDISDGMCEYCPGVIAAGYNHTRNTLWCEQEGKSWGYYHKAFYTYLVKLNKERLNHA